MPFTLGRNILTVYSKKHINDVPELKNEKMNHNKRTIQEITRLFREVRSRMRVRERVLHIDGDGWEKSFWWLEWSYRRLFAMTEMLTSHGWIVVFRVLMFYTLV